MTTDFVSGETQRILSCVAALAAEHVEARRSASVAGTIDESALSSRLSAYDFEDPMTTEQVAADLFDLLGRFAVRSDHPRYFGLFVPPPLIAGIAGDIVTATVNPQLAVWGHAPAAAEIERKLVTLFGESIWGDGDVAGTFTSGGSEANHTALLAALASKYPDWSERGLMGGNGRPTIYASAEAHLAWIKIARISGLGSDAVRLVETRDGLSLTGEALAEAIAQEEDRDPVLLVATMGTTAHGAIDDLVGIAAVGKARGVHVHVDAAWAGGALIDSSRRELFAGIELADSVTIDPHKWLAVPMGAGLYLARDWAPLATAFNVTTGYMPSASIDRHDAYIHSMQWSRRFIGCKLFMALATLGLVGYQAIINRQFALADRMRRDLRRDGWIILNNTVLPLVCFAPAESSDEIIRAIESGVSASGQAWLSSTRLRGRLVLRACVTGFETNENDIDALVTLLAHVRDGAKEMSDS